MASSQARTVCGHCGKALLEKAFKEHQRLYFHNNGWVTVKDLGKIHENDSDPRPSSGCSTPISLKSSSDSEAEKLHSPSDHECMHQQLSGDEIDAEDLTEEGTSTINNDQEDEEVEFWTECDDELDADFCLNDSHDEAGNVDLPDDDELLDHQQSVILWWVVCFTCTFQTIHRIPLGAVQWLLRFLQALLSVLSSFSSKLSAVVKKFPGSMFRRTQYLQQYLSVPKIQSKIVCSTCHKLYEFNQCLEKQGIQFISRTCSHRSSRTPLLKKIVTSTGKNRFYPILVYPYCSLITALQGFFMQPGFLELCEKWRECLSSDPSVLTDMFDGSVWNKLVDDDGTLFFTIPFSIGLILNIDWFQPYKHRSYSIGVIFLAFLNLPRAVRYKRENIILLGLIPGPKDPPVINSYLKPMVADLLSLWTGISFQLPDNTFQFVRCALVCVSCDLPAGRKACGFLHHSANFGCSRCYKPFFTGTFGQNDYSGFDRGSWVPRSNLKHRQDIDTILKCQTKTARVKKESELGCRYSCLLELSYFDPVRMLVIDSMHNLYIGTAKHMFHVIWVNRGYLGNKSVAAIKERISSLHVPSNLSFNRLPTCIDHKDAFTAEQWMVWVNFYSLFCLHGLLPTEHYKCWQHFVLASRLLCQTKMTQSDVSLADALLVKFCCGIERIYGKDIIVPNHHMHCHLIECVRDFGPLSSFWLFSFERFNGILGDQPTNNRSIELQLMHRFISDNIHIQLISKFQNHPDNHDESISVLSDMVKKYALSFYSVKHLDTHLPKPDRTTSNFEFIPALKYTPGVFSEIQLSVLLNVYVRLYPSLFGGPMPTLPAVYRKMSYIHANGRRIDADQFVLAKSVFEFSTVDIDAAHPKTVFIDPKERLAKIDHFAIHSFSPNPQPESSQVCHVFAIVSWPLCHPQRYRFGSPVQCWCHSVFESDNKNFILPIENISSFVLHAPYIMPNTDETVLVTVPCL